MFSSLVIKKGNNVQDFLHRYVAIFFQREPTNLWFGGSYDRVEGEFVNDCFVAMKAISTVTTRAVLLVRNRAFGFHDEDDPAWKEVFDDVLALGGRNGDGLEP